MKTVVCNFTKTEAMEVNSYIHPSREIGATVSLMQHAGSSHFQFSMTPNQARYLAKTLIEHADKIEDMQ